MNLHQDFLFKKFIIFFFFYGILRYNHPFLNSYWYKKNYKKNYYLPTINSLNYRKLYYRQLFLKNIFIKTSEILYIRKKYSIIYPTKLWFFRYQNWIIILWFFYKPLLKSNLNFKNLIFLNIFSKVKKIRIHKILRFKFFYISLLYYFRLNSVKLKNYDIF